MREIIIKIKVACRQEYIKVILAFLFFFSVFTVIYLTLDRIISVDDPFFHIRFVEIFRNSGMKAFTDFHWLYFSDISHNQKYFIYYNFIFYILLIPFTFIKPLFLGIKLYGVFFASLEFSLFYYFLIKIKEKKAFYWTIFALAFINYGVLTRFLLARPFTLAPIILLFFLYLAYRRKYLSIFFLSIFYFYWHTATFFFPLVAIGAYFIFENFYGRKLDWKLIGAVSLGIILSCSASLFFAPGLFEYMKDIIFGVFQETIIGKKVNLAEGGELYPVNAVDFIKQNSFILVMFILALVFEIRVYIAMKKEEIIEELENNNDVEKKPLRSTLFLLSLLFLLGTFISQRNGDFFVFISFAYIVMIFNNFLDKIRINNALVAKSISGGMILVVAVFFFCNTLFMHDLVSTAPQYASIEGTADWLKNNVSKEKVIFNVSWNWFPTLFYYNPDNYYVAGIEPRFFYKYNPKMYWLWWNISNFGYICDKEKCPGLDFKQERALKDEARKKEWHSKQGNAIAMVIRNEFKSEYVVTSKSFVRLNELMDSNNNFEKVFTDNVYNNFFIYQIK